MNHQAESEDINRLLVRGESGNLPLSWFCRCSQGIMPSAGWKWK